MLVRVNSAGADVTCNHGVGVEIRNMIAFDVPAGCPGRLHRSLQLLSHAPQDGVIGNLVKNLL